MSTEAQAGTMGPGGAAVGDRGGKYLTFFLGDEEYGLEILRVQEIFGLMDVTPVPQTNSAVEGVINLRGRVIPVVDLRRLFGMPDTERTAQTCVIVVEAQGVQTGVIVDRVSEVSDIAEKEIEDSPAFGDEVRTDFILGIGKAEGRVKLLLDIETALSGVGRGFGM